VLAGAGADDQDVHAASLRRVSDALPRGTRTNVQEPGLDKHEWETQWEGLEPLIADAPGEALSEVDDLVARMMEARGFPLVESPDEETTEPETVREFMEARRIAELVDAGEAVDPGDIGSAVTGYRNLYRYLLDVGTA